MEPKTRPSSPPEFKARKFKTGHVKVGIAMPAIDLHIQREIC